MGGTQSRSKSKNRRRGSDLLVHEVPDPIVDLGTTFVTLNKMVLESQRGQAGVVPPVDHVFVEKRYQVCGVCIINTTNPRTRVSKRRMLESVGLTEDEGEVTMYLLCDVVKSRTNSRLPNPKFIKTVGTTKWIREGDLRRCIQDEPRLHGKVEI